MRTSKYRYERKPVNRARKRQILYWESRMYVKQLNKLKLTQEDDGC